MCAALPLCGTSLKKVFHRIYEGGVPETRCRLRKRKEMVVVVENDEEVERQRRTKEEEEDHVILLWYTSSVPGSDVPLTWHTLQLASL